MQWLPVFRRILFIASLYAGYLFMGYAVERSDFAQVLIGFVFLSVGFGVLLKHREEFRFKDLFWTALLFRAAFLLSEPRLSDDLYRFMWDGAFTLQGENPYLHLPSELMEEGQAEALGIDVLYDDLNSKDYYTVYPPVNQAVFAAAVFMGGGSVPATAFWFHLILILFEALLLVLMKRLLDHFQRPWQWMALYAFHPLVIVELTGNLHFEGVVVAFMALAVWWGVRPPLQHPLFRWLPSAAAFALAVSTKLTPLMLVPLTAVVMFRFSSRRENGGWRPLLAYGAWGAVVLALTFVAFWSADLWSHWQSSIGLYFRTFEFNASVYYLVREVGQAIVGYNPIATVGPALSVASAAGILVIAAAAFRIRRFHGENIANSLLITFALYYLLATTVHPWYLVYLVALLPFASERFRGLLGWTLVVVFSYSHYHGGQFEERYGWIVAEYVIAALAFIATLAQSRASSDKN